MVFDVTHRAKISALLAWSHDSVTMAARFYRVARAKVLKLRESPDLERPGYWVFSLSHGDTPLGFVPAKSGAHTILGRHPRADLKVDDKHDSFSLRQALLRAQWVDDQLVLNVMDLESPYGIVLTSGDNVRAFDAVGPVATFMGGLTFLFIPNDPQQELPEALPVPEILGFRERDSRRVSGTYESPDRQALRVALSSIPLGTSSSVRRIAGLQRVELEALILPAPNASNHAEVDLNAAREPGGCALYLTARERVLGTLLLTREQLECGVLLGRYDRCQVLGNQSLGPQVSRVHALLILDHGALRIFDLCSTHGMTVDDERVRSATLMRHQRVGLSKELTLRVLLVSIPSTPPPPQSSH